MKKLSINEFTLAVRNMHIFLLKLWHNTEPKGFGMLENRVLDEQNAKKCLEDESKNMNGSFTIYVDYVLGRPIKVDFAKVFSYLENFDLSDIGCNYDKNKPETSKTFEQIYNEYISEIRQRLNDDNADALSNNPSPR